MRYKQQQGLGIYLVERVGRTSNCFRIGSLRLKSGPSALTGKAVTAIYASFEPLVDSRVVTLRSQRHGGCSVRL